MIVEELKKQANNSYLIIFDNLKSIKIHEDVIVKYNLFIGKKISNNLFNEILKENDYFLNYNKALNYISIRIRSKQEIERYLNRLKIDNSVILKIKNELESKGFLNDDAFLKAFINDKINMTNWGPYKIINKLNSYGIKYEESIDKVMDDKLLKKRINKIIERFIKQDKDLSIVFLKRKILIYLINLGYSKNQVIDCVNIIKIDDEADRFNRVYKKLSLKYKNKYDEERLEQVLKEKLYKLGFDYRNYLK